MKYPESYGIIKKKCAKRKNPDDYQDLNIIVLLFE